MNGISAYLGTYKGKRSYRLFQLRRKLLKKQREVRLCRRLAHRMRRKLEIIKFMRRSQIGVFSNRKTLQSMKPLTTTSVITSIALTQFKTHLPAALITNLVSSIVALITSMITLGLLKKEKATTKGLLASSILGIIANLITAISSVTALMIDQANKNWLRKRNLVDTSFITALEQEIQTMTPDELMATYKELTKAFDGKLELKKEISTQTGRASERRNTISDTSNLEPRASSPIRLAPPVYASPSAETSTVSVSQVPIIQQPVASTPVSTTAPADTMELSTNDIQDLFTPISTETTTTQSTTGPITSLETISMTTTQSNTEPFKSLELKPSTTFAPIDMKDFVLSSPPVHPDTYVETQGQFKESSVDLIIDGSNPAKLILQQGKEYKQVSVFKKPKKTATDVSGFRNMCLANCLQHFSNNKNANDMYELPDYSPTTTGKLEKVIEPFKKDEMQSIAMIQSFCAHHKANCIVYDNDGAVLATVRTTESKTCIQLLLHNKHFQFFPSQLRYDYDSIPHNFKTNSTGDIRGGADIPAVIRGISAIALTTGVGTAVLSGVTTTKIAQVIALWNSGVAFTGTAKDFGVYMCKEILGLQLDNEDSIVDIYRNLITYGTLLLTTRPADLNHDPNLVDKMKTYGSLVASAMAARVNTDTAKGLSMTLRTLVMQVNSHMESLINAATTLQTRPVPKTYMLRGAQGVGKTSLVQPLCRDISDVLAQRDIHLPPAVYDLRQDNNGYFGVYSGQPYGIVDEFQLRGDKDPFFDCLNRIVSSTSFAMPSAYVKDQFCKINCIFLCSNSGLVNLKGRFPSTSIPAIKSRIQEIEVRFCPNGVETAIHAGNRDTIVRQEDHSDLVFFYHTYDADGEPMIQQMTYSELVMLCADGISQSIAKCDLPPPNSSLEELGKLGKIIEERMSSFKIEDVGIKMQQSQSGGTEHVICHIYGDPGTGKTTLVENKILPRISACLPYLPVYNFKSKAAMKAFIANPPSTPIIALLDDMIINHPLETQDMISTCQNPSIIIHTSNQKVKEKRSPLAKRVTNYARRRAVKDLYTKEEFQQVKNYHRTWITEYTTEGLARRSGMSGTLIANGKKVLVGRDFSSCYQMSPKTSSDVSEPMIIGTKIKVEPSVITKTIFKQYCDATTRDDGLVIKPLRGITIPSQLDVDIAVESIEKLQFCCEKPLRFTLLKGNEKCELTDKVIKRYNGFVPSSTKPTGNEDPTLSLIRNFIVNLWRGGTDLQCKLQVGAFTYYAYQGVLYIPETLIANITCKDDNVKIGDTVLSMKEVHRYLTQKRMLRDYTDEDKNTHYFLAAYREEIEALPEYRAYCAKHDANVNLNTSKVQTMIKAKKLYSSIPKAVRVIATILVAASLVSIFVASVYGLVKVCSSRKKAKKDGDTSEEPEEEEEQQEEDKDKEIDSDEVPHPYVIDLGIKREEKKGKSRGKGSYKGITSEHNPTGTTTTLSYGLSKFKLQSDSMSENVRYAQGTHMLFLDSHTAVTVAHSSINTGDIIFNQPVTVFGEMPNHDIKYLSFRKAVQGVKDIHNKMAKLPDVMNAWKGTYKGEEVYMRFAKTVTNTLDGTENTRKILLYQILASRPDGIQFTFDGECGTPLIIRDPSGKRVIAGILTGSTGGTSLFSWVPTQQFKPQSQERYHTLLMEGQNREVMPEEYNILKLMKNTNNMKLNILGGVEPIGRFQFYPPPVKDTKKLTPFANKVGDLLKCPAKMTYRDEPGPYHSSQMVVQGKEVYAQLPTLINKHAMVMKDLDPEILEIAVKMSIIHKIKIHGTASKKMTPYQVLNGFRGKDNSMWSGSLGCMRLDTGAGIWQSIQKVPLKSGVLGKDSNGSISWRENPIAVRTLERCNTVLAKYRTGKVPFVIYLDSLKSELLGTDKVAEGKIRLYQAAPIEQVYAGRTLFGIFMALSNLYHLQLHSQVGINPYTDIDPIIRRFLKVSDTGEDGDYKNYDKSIPYELILAVGAVVNGIMDDGEENATGRLTYLRGMAKSVHAANGVLYSTPQGNPSGDPLTTMLNNEVNVLIEYYCFVKAFEKEFNMPPKDWEEFFHAKVDFVCAGDDKITVIHPSIQHKYNFQVKQDIITHDLGMQYTPASKETTGKPIIELMSMSFCSRRIRHDSNYDIYVGALKVESLVSLLQWVVRKTYDQMAQNINIYISEAVFHDDDTANELFLKLEPVFKTLPELRSLTSFPLTLNLTRRLIYHSLNTIRYSAEDLNETTLRANDFPCNYIEDDNIITPQNFDYKCYSYTHTDISGETFILYTLVPNTPIPITMNADWVSKLYELCQRNAWKLPEFTQKMLNKDPIVWQVHGTCEGKEGYGYESSVKKAKNAACHTLYNQLYWKVKLENITSEMAALMGETVVISFRDGEVVEEGVTQGFADINQLLKDKVKRKTLDIGTKQLQSIMPGNTPPMQVQDNKDPVGAPDMVIAGKVPAIGIVAGGITGDLRTKAFENWYEIKHGHIDATTSRYDILQTISYEKDILGGFQKLYVDAHASITGDIDVKMNIMGQPGQKGSFILCVVRSSEIGSNTTSLTPSQVTSIYSKEFSARDNTEFDFKLEFFNQTQAYIDNTQDWPKPYYTWCLLTGFKTEGLLATADAVSTISFAFRTRLSSNFVVENAFLQPTATQEIEEKAGPSQFVGKKLSEIFGEDVFLATDGTRANTVIQPPYLKNKCGKAFPFDPTEEVAKIRFPTSALWDEDKASTSYDRFDGMRCDFNNVFSNTWPTAYNETNGKYAQLFGQQPLITSEMFVRADIGYDQSDHYYLATDPLYKALDEKYGGPDATGTIGELKIKVNLLIGEEARHVITVKDCTYKTWGPTTMIEFDYKNQTQIEGVYCKPISNYGNLLPKFEYSRANLPMYFPTSKCAGAFMGYDFEALNVIEDSNKGSYYYPTVGMTRVAFTPITPPQVSATVAETGNPSINQGTIVEEKLQEIKKLIPEGKELELRIKEDYMGQFAVYIRIPADPDINPYTYSDFKYSVADFRPKGFTVVQAQILNKGAPISKRASTLFRNRIVSNTLEQLPQGVRMLDIGQKQQQAAAAIIAGGAIAGLGSALGGVGSANLNNKFWKQHNETMFNQYEKILTQKFGQQFELAEFNFDRNLSNASALIQRQMEANVEFQRQIRNMNSPAYNGSIPTGNIAMRKPPTADASVTANIADDGTAPPARKNDTIITPTSKDDDSIIIPENTTTPSTMSTDIDSGPKGNMVDRGVNTVYSQGTQDYVNKLYSMGAARQTLKGKDKHLGLGAEMPLPTGQETAAPTINLGPMQRSSLA